MKFLVGVMIFVLSIVFFAIVNNALLTPEERAVMKEEREERLERQRVEREREERAKKRKMLEEKRKGHHCLSGWDGSHWEFKELVKINMNDPDSFEHVSTHVTPVKEGRHEIIMVFRGKNAFGGTVKNVAYGSFSPDCSPYLLTIQ